MAFFPASPTDGEQANVGNITYQWSAAIGAWNRVGSTVNSFLVDGVTLTITGNILCSGTGTSQFSNNLDVLGAVDVTGSVSAGQFTTVGNATANNISANTVTSAGALSAAGITSSAAVTATGNISAGGALSSSQQVTAPVVSASGNLVAGADIVGGGNLTVAGTVNAQDVSTVGNVSALENVTATGNVTGGNVVAVADVTASGNVSGTYFLGNGALLTGVVTGGGGAGNRANVTVNTGSIANAATFTGNLIMAKGYAVYKLATTDAAWVRLYSSTATQSADSSRSQDTDPQPGSGVMVEVITNGSNVVLISPSAVGWNDESPVSNVIPISVTNLSGNSVDIGVTVTYLGIEL